MTNLDSIFKSRDITYFANKGPSSQGYGFSSSHVWMWELDCEKVGLKLNIQKTKIMASGPITSWKRDGETVETVADFTFLGSKITADGDCSHEIKDAYSLEEKLWPT